MEPRSPRACSWDPEEKMEAYWPWRRRKDWARGRGPRLSSDVRTVAVHSHLRIRIKTLTGNSLCTVGLVDSSLSIGQRVSSQPLSVWCCPDPSLPRALGDSSSPSPPWLSSSLSCSHLHQSPFSPAVHLPEQSLFKFLIHWKSPSPFSVFEPLHPFTIIFIDSWEGE